MSMLLMTRDKSKAVCLREPGKTFLAILAMLMTHKLCWRQRIAMPSDLRFVTWSLLVWTKAILIKHRRAIISLRLAHEGSLAIEQDCSCSGQLLWFRSTFTKWEALADLGTWLNWRSRFSKFSSFNTLGVLQSGLLRVSVHRNFSLR